MGDGDRWFSSSAADKARWLAGVSVGFHAAYALLGWLTLEFRPYDHLDYGVMALLFQITLVTTPVYAVIWAVGAGERLRASRGYIEISAQAYGIGTALVILFVGPFHSLTWMAILGSLAVGLMWFPTRSIIGAILTAVAIIFVGTGLGHAELIPFAPLFDTPPEINVPWLVTMIGLHLVFGGLFAGLLWRGVRLIRAQARELERLAATDALTGIFNRRRIVRALAESIDTYDPTSEGLAVVLVDLDGFKLINDQHGHLAGDRVLVEAAQRLEQAVADAGFVGRYGGDEFVLVFPNVSRATAEDLAERCRSALATIAEHIPEAEKLDASVGLYHLTNPGNAEGEVLLKRADDALYEAKRRGKGRVVTSQSMDYRLPTSS